MLWPVFIIAIPNMLGKLFDTLAQIFEGLDRKIPKCKWLEHSLDSQNEFRRLIYKKIAGE